MTVTEALQLRLVCNDARHMSLYPHVQRRQRRIRILAPLQTQIRGIDTVSRGLARLYTSVGAAARLACVGSGICDAATASSADALMRTWLSGDNGAQAKDSEDQYASSSAEDEDCCENYIIDDDYHNDDDGDDYAADDPDERDARSIYHISVPVGIRAFVAAHTELASYEYPLLYHTTRHGWIPTIQWLVVTGKHVSLSAIEYIDWHLCAYENARPERFHVVTYLVGLLSAENKASFLRDVAREATAHGHMAILEYALTLLRADDTYRQYLYMAKKEALQSACAHKRYDIVLFLLHKGNGDDDFSDDTLQSSLRSACIDDNLEATRAIYALGTKTMFEECAYSTIRAAMWFNERGTSASARWLADVYNLNPDEISKL